MISVINKLDRGTFRSRKPDDAKTIKIPKLDEEKIIKKMNMLHPNLIKGDTYKFKISRNISEFIGTFDGKGDDGYAFKNIEMYMLSEFTKKYDKITVKFGEFELIESV